MTEKEQLLKVIKQKGHCSFIDCLSCPINLNNNWTCIEGDKNADTYKKAVNMYINTFGKDAELLEVLI